jgi:hypothetical protein
MTVMASTANSARRSVPRSVIWAARRVPGLRRVPVVALISAGEVALIARDHVRQLTPEQRHRLVELVRRGRGRRGRLSAREQEELSDLLERLEARQLLGEAIRRVSPVPLPRRIVEGPDWAARGRRAGRRSDRGRRSTR